MRGSSQSGRLLAKRSHLYVSGRDESQTEEAQPRPVGALGKPGHDASRVAAPNFANLSTDYPVEYSADFLAHELFDLVNDLRKRKVSRIYRVRAYRRLHRSCFTVGILGIAAFLIVDGLR
jgi:hypothetical protein